MQGNKDELVKEILAGMDTLIKPLQKQTICPACGKEARNGIVYNLQYYHQECLRKKDEIVKK